MKLNAIILAVTCFLSCSSISYCDSGLSYDDTVALIKNTMSNNTSSFRQESYRDIKFDRCRLEYTVAGRYPAGDTYDIRYGNIDISSLNPQRSKTSHDYTAFLILNFNEYLEYNTGSKSQQVKTVVINAANDVATKTLLEAFLHLKKICNGEEVGKHKQ